MGDPAIDMGVCRIVASILIVATLALAASEEVVPLNEDTVVLLDDTPSSLPAMKKQVAQAETALEAAKATVLTADKNKKVEEDKKADAVKEGEEEVAAIEEKNKKEVADAVTSTNAVKSAAEKEEKE